MIDLPPLDSINDDYGTNPLHAALAKAQAALTPALKDSTNPHFRNKYADLTSVWDACRKPLTDNGLCVTQTFETEDQVLVLVTTLRHIQGGTVLSRLPVVSKDPQNPQALGSSITYMRRYALASMVGVVADDDDGQSAARPSPAQPPTALAERAYDRERDIGVLRSILGSIDSLRSLEVTQKNALYMAIDTELVASKTPTSQLAEVVRKHVAKYL